MFKKINSLSATRLATYGLLVFALFTFAATVYMTFNIDVLQEWRLELPKQDKIHVGDKITIASIYHKTMNVKGTSVRYLDCKNKDGIEIRYPLNQAVADRAPKKGGTGIVVVMPDTIPDLPARCRVAVVIDYPVLPWRHVIETEETREFTLHPKEVASVSSESNEPQRTTEIPVPATPSPASTVASVPSSSTNDTPINYSAQQDISQGEPVSNQTIELEPTPQPVIRPCTLGLLGICVLR